MPPQPYHITFPICGIINGTPQFIATGFFIDMLGGFITAKHVLDQNAIDEGTEYLILQLINEQFFQPRRVAHIFHHPTADISLGKPHTILVDGEDFTNPIWPCNFEPPEVGDSISTYAYPNSHPISPGSHQWRFVPEIFQGEIIQLHDRCPTCGITTDCYQSNMHMTSGSSGGPVFNDIGEVIGINSLSFELGSDEEPLSFITPLALVREIEILSEGTTLLYGDLYDQQANT